MVEHYCILNSSHHQNIHYSSNHRTGAKIDLAHHDSEYRSALEEALQLEKAIALADAMTDPQDTLILLTADHSHSLVINGYADLRDDVRGECVCVHMRGG